MSRFAFFAIFCVTLLVGCAQTPPTPVPISSVEYRWGDDASVSYRPLPSMLREPPNRGDAQVLHVRFTLPDVGSDDPALLVGSYTFHHATVDGRRIEPAPRATEITPFNPGDAGKIVDLVFIATYRIEVGELRVGSERDVFTYAFSEDLPQFTVGVTLAIAGIFLLVAAFVRRRKMDYAWMGLFAVSVGLAQIGQATPLALLVFPSKVVWARTIPVGRLLLAIGLLEFTVVVFGDTPRRVLRWLTRSFVALMALQLFFSTGVGLNPISRVAPFFIIAGAITIFSVVWKRRSETNARIFLWGFAALFLITLPDLAWSAGYGIFDYNLTPFGVLAFTSAMVLVVERNYRDKASALETSTVALTERVRELESNRKEIESLNDELRHQVETRSRELRNALSGGLASVQGPAQELAAGDLVGDRYRIVRRIGEGAMGAVYEAERRTDQKRFALKVMTGSITATDAARFAREAEMAAQLRHENLVAILDVGVHASRSPYLVLELVVGRALDDASDRFGDVKWALRILRDITAGLAALHQRGVVHRDLKPANVLLEKSQNGSEKAKIGDFGIAREGDEEAPASGHAHTMKAIEPKSASRSDAKITQTGALVGTPLYMAPEAAGGGVVTRAADVFALSLLAYEILTKARPFDPPAVLQALAGHTIPRVTLPATLRLDLELASAIEHGLAADPGERPTAAELERILSIVVARES